MIAEYILPLPAASSSSGKTAEVDEVAWTERLLCTMRFLDETASNSLRALSNIRGVYVYPSISVAYTYVSCTGDPQYMSDIFRLESITT